jgi:RNA polymerase sigma-70 factor (ECF subfamily)
MIEHTMTDPIEAAYHRLKQGDPHALSDLLTACQPRVYRLALSILNDEEDAADATQEALLAVAEALPGFRGEARFTTWMTTITVNTCRSYLRKRKRRGSLIERLQRRVMTTQLTSPTPSPEVQAQRSEADRALWQAVDALEEKHRLPIVLRYAHDMPTRQIAEVLGVSEGTVHSRLHHAREHIRRLLMQKGGL